MLVQIWDRDSGISELRVTRRRVDMHGEGMIPVKKKGGERKEDKFPEYHGVDATIKIWTIFMVIEITVGPYRVADGIEKYFLRGYAHEQ